MITENVDLLFQVQNPQIAEKAGIPYIAGSHSRSLWLPGRGEHCCEASDARPRACQVSAVGKQFSKEIDT